MTTSKSFTMMATTTARTFVAGCMMLTGVAAVPGVLAQMSTPYASKHLYPDVQDARADVAAAFVKAKREHKRVLLVFGGDWCGDCQVLDIYFNEAPNAELLAKHYVRVNVNIGRQDANLDIANKYGVPVHGVPALAVVDANGKVIVSQDKEFSNMRNMQATSVTEFLTKWKK